MRIGLLKKDSKDMRILKKNNEDRLVEKRQCGYAY